MLARKFVGKLDSFLREAKEVPDVLFGNVVVVFCGDFFQIPPVGSDPVYIEPSNSNYKCSLDDRVGYDIWRNSLHSVVILEENMRQSGEEEYAEQLNRLRYGNLSKEDVILLNERVIVSKTFQELRESRRSHRLSPANAPIVIKGNELRQALNWECAKHHAKSLSMKPIVCVAVLKAATRGNFTRKDLQVLFRTNDTQTANLPVLLPFLPGMPVRVTQNIAVEIGIANGTNGTLCGLQFDRSTSFENATIFDVDCIIPNKLPTVAFVEFKRETVHFSERFKTIPSQCSNQTVPLIPVENLNCNTRLGKVRLSTGNKLSIKQLPFVPSYASTTYKMQGKTTDNVIAFPFLKGPGGKTPSAALYVVLARVNTRNGLFLFEKISTEHTRYFVPPLSLLEEDKRLRSFPEATLQKYQFGVSATP